MSRLVPPVGVNPTEFSVTVKGSPCQKLTSATWLPSWQRGHKTKPVQRLVLLLRTWEVSGVLPGCETGYADEELVQYNRTDTHTHTPDKRSLSLPSTSLPIHHSAITARYAVWSCRNMLTSQWAKDCRQNTKPLNLTFRWPCIVINSHN